MSTHIGVIGNGKLNSSFGILGVYKNGNYDVIIMKDGTKIRIQKDDNADFIPDFAESMDVTITYNCDGKCPYCYADCTPEGKHGDIMNETFINSLHPYTEIAINGNDLSHPKLHDFLHALREKKVIVNMTVSQRHFMEHLGYIYNLQRMNYIHGIGISYSNPSADFAHFLNGNYENVVIHTIAGLLSLNDINFLKKLNRPVLILGYKNKGRGALYKMGYGEDIEEGIKDLSAIFNDLIKDFPVVTFDNLAIEQLGIKNKLSKEQWEKFYMGDEGSATFFVDLVNKTFARSSLETENFPIGDKTVDEMFKFIQNKYEGKIDG